MNTELNTTTEHQVLATIAPAMPPNGAIILDTTGEAAPLLPPIPTAVKSFDDLTLLEKVEHHKYAIEGLLGQIKLDLADNLKKAVGAIKSLNTHGAANVLSDPLLDDVATFLKGQLNLQPEPEKEDQADSGEKTASNRVDAVVRRLLMANAPMTEAEIIKALPAFAEERIKKTLKNRSEGKTPCFKCDNNKWKVIKK